MGEFLAEQPVPKSSAAASSSARLVPPKAAAIAAVREPKDERYLVCFLFHLDIMATNKHSEFNLVLHNRLTSLCT